MHTERLSQKWSNSIKNGRQDKEGGIIPTFEPSPSRGGGQAGNPLSFGAS